MIESRASARRRLAARFAEAGLESADTDARLLVCAAAGIDHARLIREPDVGLSAPQEAQLSGFAARRLQHEPVSRIIGRRAFWGLDFIVSAAVLDPRPETEGLVASVLDTVGVRRTAPLSILDLGTGSGAILCALLSELPQAYGIGIDRAESACRIARRNLRTLGLSARGFVVCADWAGPLAVRFDIVVSNPPYIATADIEGLDPEVREHDPLAALDGGADGLAAYRAIIPAVTERLEPGGIIALECGAGQGASVASMISAAGLPSAAVYKDLAGHDRVVLAARVA